MELLAIAAGLCLLVGFALAFGQREQLPVTLAKDAKPGERVRLCGTVHASKSLASPMTGEACVWWKLTFVNPSTSRLSVNGMMNGPTTEDRLEGGGRRGAVKDSTSEWADGLRLDDASGELLLDPTGGSIESTHGSDLKPGFVPSDSVRELIRRHAPGGAESNPTQISERRLNTGVQVTVEGVVEDVKGRRILAGDLRFHLAPGTPPEPHKNAATLVWLGRSLLGLGALGVIGVLLMLSS